MVFIKLKTLAKKLSASKAFACKVCAKEVDQTEGPILKPCGHYKWHVDCWVEFSVQKRREGLSAMLCPQCGADVLREMWPKPGRRLQKRPQRGGDAAAGGGAGETGAGSGGRYTLIRR